MMTLKEFEDHFVAKGMDRQWATDEWWRRNRDMSGQWRTDTDPDCKLPRVQLNGRTFEVVGTEASTTDSVEATTAQIRNPKARDMENLLKGLGQDVNQESAASSLKSGDLLSLMTDFKFKPGDNIEFGAQEFFTAAFANAGKGANPEAAAAGKAPVPGGQPPPAGDGQQDDTPKKASKQWDRDSAIGDAKGKVRVISCHLV